MTRYDTIIDIDSIRYIDMDSIFRYIEASLIDAAGHAPSVCVFVLLWLINGCWLFCDNISV